MDGAREDGRASAPGAGEERAAPVALTIAAARAVLVILFFMELADSLAAPRFTMAVALLLLVILPALAADDVLTRMVTALPSG